MTYVELHQFRDSDIAQTRIGFLCWMSEKKTLRKRYAMKKETLKQETKSLQPLKVGTQMTFKTFMVTCQGNGTEQVQCWKMGSSINT